MNTKQIANGSKVKMGDQLYIVKSSAFLPKRANDQYRCYEYKIESIESGKSVHVFHYEILVVA